MLYDVCMEKLNEILSQFTTQRTENYGTAEEGGGAFVDTDQLVNYIIFFLIAVVILGLTIVLLYGLYKRFKKAVKTHSLTKKSLDTVLYEIRVPRNNETEIQASDQLFSSLTGIQGGLKWRQKAFGAKNFISFEIVAFPQLIKFYVCAPRKIAATVEKQINAVYPDAEIIPTSEYNIFPKKGRVAFTSMVLDKDAYKGLRTYEELSSDIISSITSTMSKVQKGEALAVQVVVSPAESDWRKSGKKYVNKVRENNADPEKSKMDVDDDVLASIEKKCEKPGFYTDIRLVSIGNTDVDAISNLSGLLSSFDQLSKEGSNKLKKKGDSDKKAFMKDFVYRIPRDGSILNTAELGTIFHFPNQTVKTPHINWLLAKRAPAGSLVPDKKGKMGVWLGVSKYRDAVKNIYINLEDRRRHFYYVGKTGTGKTWWLQNMILQDIQQGAGLAFLDPHGDSVEWLLERIPPERAEDVIYFNPADIERPMGLNIIEYYNENDKHLVTNAFINLLYKMFDPNKQGIVGPRLEQSVRNAMLTAMAKPDSTLIEVMRIITDDKFMKTFLDVLDDDVVKRFWTDQMAQTSDFHKSEVLGYIVSKFDRFVTNKMMRNILGQSNSGFNIRQVMDSGKILLVNLSKGLVGEENAQFLGLLLIPKILSAAMSRANQTEEERRDFFLYVDEFQNFATEDFAQILSEARKYRLNLIVANQYISQIDDKIRDAVFGNVGTMASFKVGVDDAAYLQNWFHPVFDQDDLINLENRNLYIKLLVDGEYPAPFSMMPDMKYAPHKWKEGSNEMAQLIKELSRLRYGRDAKLVQAEINKRANLTVSGDDASNAGKRRPGGFGQPANTPLKPKAGG
ncbi:type IV secretion system DNA-binding domain-containing protein [Candidatus Dojkabacteria bacterium]|nr:type IV secretion system DNA-binding domain-containing protein [Candidatus Dojkabacteria bacterium]